MAGSFTVLSHTADTGIAIEADTLSELFEWAARGMCSLMYDLDGLVPERTLEVAVEAASVDELLVDVLSELLYWSEADDVVPCTFEVIEASGTGVHFAAGAVPARPELLTGPPIKAVTYHDLHVGEVGGKWRGRVVFDV